MTRYEKVEFMIELALGMAKEGIPYRWGGSNPLTGFDCSGLIVELLKSVGLVPDKFDTNSRGLYQMFKDKEVKKPDRGCLVFFGPSKAKINHIGLMINDELMIEAGGGGSKTRTLEDAAKQGAWIRVRPYKRRSDVVAFVSLL